MLSCSQSTELNEYAAHELPEAEVDHNPVQGVLGLIQEEQGAGSQQVQKTIGLMAEQGKTPFTLPLSSQQEL